MVRLLWTQVESEWQRSLHRLNISYKDWNSASAK